MTDSRSSSALFKRAEQLKRWEESDTNKQSAQPKNASRIQFSSGIVFLAACTAGDKDEVQRLLKMGADINTANVDGLTALHQACIDDNLDMVEFLVGHGADVNRGDNEGWTALHATSSCGFLSIARYLLENGADVGAVNYDGELPIDIAESDNMAQIMQEVIDEKGVDCDKSRNAEVNMLRQDARNWAANGYVEVRDPKTGGTPLHVAAAKGYVDVAKVLLEDCNVDPDCMDYEGWTPLHAAALWCQKEAASLLLKHGADSHIKNYSGQTCIDLVDQSMSAWFAEAILKSPRKVNNNNNNKRKRSPPQLEIKRVELQIQDEKSPAEIMPKIADKPPKVRAPSPEGARGEPNDDAPSWRRSASFRNRQAESAKENNRPPANTVDNDTILRRTHSFENDKTVNQGRLERETWGPSATTAVTTSVLTSPTNTTQTTVRSSGSDSGESSPSPNSVSHSNSATNSTTNSSNSTPSATTPTKLSPGNIFKNFFKSFVPPVRDEESETQRKAHAKRVRETRRSTQGVTLDEIKSAEQLVKKKTGNGTETPPPVVKKEEKEADAFELEDASGSPASRAANNTEVTVTVRRPPSGSTHTSGGVAPTKDDSRSGEEERESSSESKSSSSPVCAQAAANVIQRRRRPKRRSTGVGHVDMDDIVNDRGGGVDGDADTEAVQSGSERTEECEERDYKALYEASQVEVKRLRALLATSEQQLRDARATITKLTQVNQNSLSEIEKREKRAMERKLSEMEEELKFHQALQAENQRLKDENGALIRVISKLSK